MIQAPLQRRFNFKTYHVIINTYHHFFQHFSGLEIGSCIVSLSHLDIAVIGPCDCVQIEILSIQSHLSC